MTAKKQLNELYEILSDVRTLESKIKQLELLPNWETRLKNDILRHIANLDFGVSDFIVSAELDQKGRF